MELVKSAGNTDVSTLDLLRDAEEAFEALSTLLGDDAYFFSSTEPTLFDASVFAYTCLILNEELGWRHNPLGERLGRYGNLVRHRGKILEGWF